MAAPPKRIQDLVIQACCYLGREDLPEINWRRAKDRKGSSGIAWPGLNKFNITAGSDYTEQKMVTLHELAHLTQTSGHHDQVFWAVAWELFRWAKLPIRATLKREGGYRKGAVVAYHRQRKEKQ